MTKINLNDKVLVKLTEVGIKELERQRKKLIRELEQRGVDAEIPELEIDENGYSIFQLHELMQQLGHLCGPGTEPFEFDIEVMDEEFYEDESESG